MTFMVNVDMSKKKRNILLSNFINMFRAAGQLDIKYVNHQLYMSDGFYLVKWRLVLWRTPVCQKQHN